MTQSNRAALEKYRPKLAVWINDQTCHLEGQEKDEILRIVREEFEPNYHIELYCHSCVVKMMEYAFRRMDELTTINIPLK